MAGRTAKRTAVLLAVAAGIGAFFWLDGPKHLNLEALKASRQGLADLYAARPVLMLGGYFLLYVAVAGLALPGAAVLTLAGSAVFGFWAGLAVVSLASTAGASLACLLARYVLREWVAARFPQALDRVDRGMAGTGAGVWYLFSLRLVPVVPFFLINLAMGLTAMPLRTFWWVSQLGMLPGTAVYVFAGVELGRVNTLGDVVSPGMLAALCLLGVFPLVARWALSRLGRARGRGAA
ncbi:TVP38/TMEM64 family inner membrane protein YdjZ [Fundidesulfovibrio magnetotacticus]|uniref:TVP38/TMEM64 family membrane protein n=1 Tax=Fundidesulfovibrio magnetotacticus TaxID=2730080 RepID=A0A6V8LRF8_9BACT|nr:TVP38/TMEM64 family protein [Fundidesulfovibrio magnetotacticus]GFK95072.1 TVP38/TMEM64 family inner membrane protein YdjZ [Fundidesulfovibrio magnetotacticus]